jgi:hypothetical protein
MLSTLDANSSSSYEIKTHYVRAIKFAAENGHHQALGLLLNTSDFLNQLLLTWNLNLNLDTAVEQTAKKSHYQALNVLLTKNILQKLSYYSPKEFYSIKKQLNEWKKGDNEQLKNIADTTLKTIKEIKNEKYRKTVKTAVVAGGVVAGGAAAVVGGTFVGALLAKKGIKLIKDTRLVTSCLLPLFNATNKLLMKISPKLDLNNLAKALTNPKIAGLVVGVIAILGVISSIVAGVVHHTLQSGIAGGASKFVEAIKEDIRTMPLP